MILAITIILVVVLVIGVALLAFVLAGAAALGDRILDEQMRELEERRHDRAVQLRTDEHWRDR